MPPAALAKLSRAASTGELDAIDAVSSAVDAKGRAMDEKWGIGRLITLVPVEWADRFHTQSRKFSLALQDWNYPEALKHGQAMERAYAKLDELATASGAEHGKPEQWEFETPDGLVILVKDIQRTNQVDRQGRQAQVWSLDEIASVIRAHPEIVKAKTVFSGAEVVSIRPVQARKIGLEANDDIPF